MIKVDHRRGPQGKNTHPLRLKMKAYKVPCFKPSDGLKKRNKGDLRTLEHNTQASLNDLSICEYRENLERYKKVKRKDTRTAQNLSFQIEKDNSKK